MITGPLVSCWLYESEPILNAIKVMICLLETISLYYIQYALTKKVIRGQVRLWRKV